MKVKQGFACVDIMARNYMKEFLVIHILSQRVLKSIPNICAIVAVS